MSIETGIPVGCAAFGLADAVAVKNGQIQANSFSPACAVLPDRPFGEILTGAKAQEDRVQSGNPWPPEARVEPGKPIRRAPLPCVWRAFVESGDVFSRWEAGHGISFPLSHILGNHIEELIGECRIGAPFPVIAIPNDLDEFGQEALIDCLAVRFRAKRDKIALIWRPVAVALSWLQKAGQLMLPRRLTDDFILVVYLGPDAIEFVTLGIEARRHEDLWHILPKRDRPHGISPLAGFDWAADALEILYPSLQRDIGAFWQGFAIFPEIWEALAEHSWNSSELPRIWGLRNEWGFWNPKLEDAAIAAFRAPCRASEVLKDLLKPSCRLDGTVSKDTTWPERLTELLSESLRYRPQGKLKGLILCGALAPAEPPDWLKQCFPELEARGLNTSAPYNQCTPGQIWCTPGNVAIAQGAAIYGKCLQSGEPTYLDTLPQLFLLAQKQGKLTPYPLTDLGDVEGGKTYTNPIKEKFTIEGGMRKLDILMTDGTPSIHWQIPLAEKLDSHVCIKATRLSLGQSSLVRHMVRLSAILSAEIDPLKKNVENNPQDQRYFLKLEAQKSSVDQNLKKMRHGFRSALSDYLKTYEELFSIVSRGHIPIEKGGPSVRHLSFAFPAAIPETMPVDILVRIKPASGRAQLEVVPQVFSFLKGRRIYADYEKMRRLDEIPSLGLGWPPLEEIIPYQSFHLTRNKRQLLQQFIDADSSAVDYRDLLSKISQKILKSKDPSIFGGNSSFVNQKGEAENENIDAIVQKIAEALTNQTNNIYRLHREDSSTPLRNIIVQGSWLFGATPTIILEVMRSLLKQPSNEIIQWIFLIEAASRAFSATMDFALLFQAITNHIRFNPASPFPIQAVRAASNVLMYHPNGQDALDDHMAFAIFDQTIKILDEQAEVKNKFFQCLKLLLYLLRYRKHQPNFLDKEMPETVKLFEKLDEYEERMRQTLPPGRRAIAARIIQGIRDFILYAGSTIIVPIIASLETEQEDEDGIEF